MKSVNSFALIMVDIVALYDKANEMKRKFHEALNNVTVRANSALIIAVKYSNLVQECKDVKKYEKKKPKHYWLMKHYDVIEVEGVENLTALMEFHITGNESFETVTWTGKQNFLFLMLFTAN